MEARKSFNWDHLSQLRIYTNIPDEDYMSRDAILIGKRKKEARAKWRACKKRSAEMRKKYLSERAEYLAIKMRATEEKALRAIIQAEESKSIYRSIKDLMGKSQTPLTQVDINCDSVTSPSLRTTLTSKPDVEHHILRWNRTHSLQSLSTPFLSKPFLCNTIDPLSDNNKFDKLLDGTFLEDATITSHLNEPEKLWLASLQQIINSEISLSISCDEFNEFFRTKREGTSSSPSGRHFGHYQSILECIRCNDLMLPSLIINIAYISLTTATPLAQWQVASQVMLEKGKGQFIEHLHIIQLCEADLNFILHVIWGHRLIRHAIRHSSLSTSQFAIPGQTCNNAVLNKLLFLDLSRQSLSAGVLTDFDATAAFDRVIAGLSIVTCQRVGLPRVAGCFMFHLLRQMSFHLVTGFGKSVDAYSNNEDLIVGQGVLQGSSSAAPIFLLNSDVSLSANLTAGIGASFENPISGEIVTDHAVQFVDDTSQFLNFKGMSSATHTPLPIPLDSSPSNNHENHLISTASYNSQLWADLLWTSGGGGTQPWQMFLLCILSIQGL